MFIYELVYIIPSTLKENDISAVQKEVQDALAGADAEIVRENPPIQRSLAYKIKKHAKGVYICLEYNAATQSVKKIDDFLRLNQKILRHQIVKIKKRTEEDNAKEKEKHEKIKQFFRERRAARRASLSKKSSPRPISPPPQVSELQPQKESKEEIEIKKEAPPALSELELAKKLDEILEQDIEI